MELWFSFSVMCGAIFEGLLYGNFENFNFQKLIEIAILKEVIGFEDEKNIKCS
jgi:hypothetical protein